jgi:hypothetical protein
METIDEKHKRLREVEIRWQGIRIQQLSFSNNLIFTFSLALLGFITKELLQSHLWCSPKAIFSILGFSLIGVSLLAGILTTISRLQDFRDTARLTVAKRKQFENLKLNLKLSEKDEILVARITSLRKETQAEGKITWGLFYLQLASFFAGALMTGLAIFMKMFVVNQ